jgi:hypothetical protein
VADEKKPQSPEELGEAVGRKIEALFGGMFDDSAEKEPDNQDAGGSAEQTGSEPTAPPEPPPQASPPTPPSTPPPSPPRRSNEAPSTAEPPRAEVSKPPPGEPRVSNEDLDILLDQIEALILNLEWEATRETVQELTKKFGEADSYFPEGNPGKKLIHMNHRVLHRQASDDSSPHPLLVKLLEESVAVLKLLSSSGGTTAPDRSVLTGITSTFNEIVSSFQPEEAASEASPETVDFGVLMSDMDGAVHSLEEVGQRLARIRAVLRKGGEMPDEEIVRRLGTLESMLSERVGKLVTVHRDLERIGGPQGIKGGGRGEFASDGLLMVEWYRLPLAIPSAIISALYPLAKHQGELFMDKSIIVIANRRIPRLPLKKPRSADQARNRPASWLIRLSFDDREFFLLADRATGYRRSPEGTDPTKENRIKIGNTTYLILSPTIFR